MPAKAAPAPRKTLASVSTAFDHRCTQLERDSNRQAHELALSQARIVSIDQTVDAIVRHRLQEAWLLAGLFIATNALTLILHFTS